MNCFRFSYRERDETAMRPRKSPSSRSNSSMSTDRDIRRSGSEFSMDMSTESFGRITFPYVPQMPSNLRIFMYQELKNATRNFSRALMLGEGGFGCVYRGTIRSVLEPDKKMDVAVKQLGRKGLQGHKEWLTEVNVLGMVDHQNLVKLVGYCAEEDERGIQLLLVYEFMPNRSLEDHLSPRSTQPLTWPMRLRIALDAARGLKYLHEECEVKIIFRDLKPSNILLDAEWNAKLSDFGLARLGSQEESHVSTAVVGTLGYAAPEYLHTGRLATKSDVWSYGVVLYELITGRKPMDRNRPKGEQGLLEWIKPYISDVKKFPVIVDPRLEVDPYLKSIMKLGSVANKCLVRHPRSRPKMSEVLEMVQKIVDNLDNGGGTPEHLIMGPVASEQGPVSQQKKSELELGKWITWPKWTPKLVRTH
ncbi:serine/threonine-protein kinase PCRK1-like isoform X1 [Carex rostrata]